MTFSFFSLQGQIEKVCQKIRADTPDLFFDTGWGLPLSDALFCAEDRERNAAFFRALTSAFVDLPPHPVVFDAGAGLGVLGLFSLLLGAKKVLFFEINPITVLAGKRFLQHFAFSGEVEWYAADARTVVPSEKAHLFVSETITADFSTEDFFPIVRNLSEFLLPPKIIIPESFLISCSGGPSLALSALSLLDEPIPLVFPAPLPESVVFSVRTTLYKNESLGNTASYGNSRQFFLKNPHPFFTFSEKDE